MLEAAMLVIFFLVGIVIGGFCGVMLNGAALRAALKESGLNKKLDDVKVRLDAIRPIDPVEFEKKMVLTQLLFDEPVAPLSSPPASAPKSPAAQG